MYLTFLLIYFDRFRRNKDEIFQQITEDELKTFNILANYKLLDKGEEVFFTDKGIALRDSTNLRMVLYSDIYLKEIQKVLNKSISKGEYPSRIKIPLQTPKIIRYLYGGQSLKIYLPDEDDKRKIIVKNLKGILGEMDFE